MRHVFGCNGIEEENTTQLAVGLCIEQESSLSVLRDLQKGQQCPKVILSRNSIFSGCFYLY